MNKLYLIITLLIATSIRLFHAPTRTYFNNCDELISATSSSGLVYTNIPSNKVFHTSELLKFNFPAMIENSIHGGYGGDNGNCFFFNLSLSIWTKIFGISNLAFRSFSMLCDVLSIILIFLIIQLIGSNPLTALISGTMLAISPIFVAFGGDFIRTYSFTTLITLISFWLYLKTLGSPEKLRYYFLFTLTLILTFFSHFLSYYIFIGFLFYAFMKRKQNPLFFKRISIFIVSAGILCIGILSFNKEGIADMKKRNNDLEARAAAKTTASQTTDLFTLKTITLATFQYFLSYYTGSFSLTAFAKALGLQIIPLIFFIVFLLLPFALFYAHRKEFRKKEHIYLLWVMTLSGNLSAILIMFASKHFTSLDIRYSIFTIPFYFILLSQIDFKNKFIRLIPLASCIIALIGLAGTFNRNLPKELNLDFYNGKKGLTVQDLPVIKQMFHSTIDSLSQNETLLFNNPDDYLFYTLITNGKYLNPCFIDSNLPDGISITANPEKALLAYKYYGTD